MQKEWRLRRKKLLLLTMPDKVKGAVFRENQMGDHKLTYREQITNFTFWFSLTLKLFSAYMENTLNREKKQKYRSISTNIRPKPKIFKILVYTLDRFERSKKSSHATVPLSLEYSISIEIQSPEI
jgi:hypothetical protein